MDRENATKRETPDASDARRTVSKQAEQAPAGPPAEGKPDEGTRPSNLTSENDGGAEG